MQTEKILLLGIFLIFLVFFTVSTMITVSYAANDNVTIDVNVSETSSIIVIPSAINWTGLSTHT
jgi:hypothetical protein